MATKAAAAKKAPAKAPAKTPAKKAPAKKATVKKTAAAPKKLRVAIIGCGGISHAHMAAYKSIPEVELVGFCDILPERLKEYQEKYGAKPEQCFEKWDDLFKVIKPDAVDICTPNGVHCPAAVAAADPPLLPPGIRAVSHGFFVFKNALFSQEEPMANSSMFRRPQNTAPASSNFSAAVAV